MVAMFIDLQSTPYFDAPVMIDVMKRHIVVQCFSLCSSLFSSDFGDDAQCYI